MDTPIFKIAADRESGLADYTDQQLVARAVATLIILENRIRKTRAGFRLPVIEAIIEFGKTLPGLEDAP